jgi:tetratricopeptide (TPR) repeat protein
VNRRSTSTSLVRYPPGPAELAPAGIGRVSWWRTWITCAWWWPWSVVGRLRRGERALCGQRWTAALRVLSSGLARLDTIGRRSYPSLVEERFLSGLVAAAEALGRDDDAVLYCRRGRSRELSTPAFYELPALRCTEAGRGLTKAQRTDLRSWVEWPGAALNPELGHRLEMVLQCALDVTPENEQALRKLADARFGWVWPELRLAEYARRRGEWETCATRLARGIALGPADAQQHRLRWSEALCWFLARRYDKSHEALTRGRAPGLARTTPQWRLEVVVLRKLGRKDEAFRVAAEGASAIPGAVELAALLESLAWDRKHAPALGGIAREWRVHTPSPAAWLWSVRLECLAAVVTQDLEAGAECARLIVEQADAFAEEHAFLRVVAAQLLFLHGSLQPQQLERLSAGIPSQEWPRLRAGLAEHQAASAFRRREYGRVVEIVVLALEAGLCLASSAIELLFDTLDELKPLAAYDITLRRLHACTALWSQSPETCPAIPWMRAAEHGLLQVAECRLAHDLRQAEPNPDGLRALALVNLALSLSAGAARDRALASRALIRALGAIAAVMGQDEALGRFVAARLECYGAGTSTTSVGRFSEIVDDWVRSYIDQQAESVGTEAGELRLLWSLESHAAQLVSQEARQQPRPAAPIAGPLFGASMGWQDQCLEVVRNLERASAGSSQDDFLELLFAMLSSGRAQSKPPETSRMELRQLFSPLAPATILLSQGRIGPALASIRRCLRQSNGRGENGAEPTRIDTLLSSYVKSAEDRTWVAKTALDLMTRCWLESARQEVSRVPIDFEAVTGSWRVALAEAEGLGCAEPVKRGLAEVCIGRSLALETKRSRRVRLADETDKRANQDRLDEALALLRLGWDLTGDASVQATFTRLLNTIGVTLAEEHHRLEEAIELLFEALSVNPRARLVTSNLLQVALAAARELVDEDAERAAQLLIGIRERTRAAGLESEEVERLLAGISADGSTPFYNRSAAAMEAEDWTSATYQMLLAARVGPDDSDVQLGLIGLESRLRAAAAAGDETAVVCLERIRKSPHGVLTGLAQLISLMQLGASPRVTNRAAELNQRGVRFANEGNFEKAAECLREARRLDPDDQTVAMNVRNVAQAWFTTATGRGDRCEAMRAIQWLSEADDHG